MKTGINISASMSVEELHEVRTLILDILESTAEEKTKRVALDSLAKLVVGNVTGTTIRDVNIGEYREQETYPCPPSDQYPGDPQQQESMTNYENTPINSIYGIKGNDPVQDKPW